VIEMSGVSGSRPFYADYEIYDEWGDNKLTGRTPHMMGGILKGIMSAFVKARPEWTTVSGTPSASEGRLILPIASEVKTPTIFFVGTWEIHFNYDDIPTAGGGFPLLWTEGGASYYAISWLEAVDEVRLDHTGTATIISGILPADTGVHIFKATRDAAANWELFADNVSQGTANDPSHGSIDAIGVKNATDAGIKTDNFEAYE